MNTKQRLINITEMYNNNELSESEFIGRREFILSSSSIREELVCPQ